MNKGILSFIASLVLLPAADILAQDTTPPTAEFTSPTANQKISGNFLLTVSASDVSGIARVRFEHHEILIGEVTTAPYVMNWDTTTLHENGWHLVYAIVWDNAGNSTIVDVVPIIDNPESVYAGNPVEGTPPPAVENNTPPGGAGTPPVEESTPPGGTGTPPVVESTPPGGAGTPPASGTGGVSPPLGGGGAVPKIPAFSSNLPVVENLVVVGGGSTTASMSLGASLLGTQEYRTDFSDGDTVTIAAEIFAESDQLLLPANVYILLRTPLASGRNAWFYKDIDGNFNLLNGGLETLQHADHIPAMESWETFTIFEGVLLSGQYRVYIGYQSADDSLTYSQRPLIITVN